MCTYQRLCKVVEDVADMQHMQHHPKLGLVLMQPMSICE
jgi:hypothetical protein